MCGSAGTEPKGASGLAWDAEMPWFHIECFEHLCSMYEWQVTQGGYKDVEQTIGALIALADGLAAIKAEARELADGVGALGLRLQKTTES